tara:strand:- start:192 stop:392 length:201 start_codon:yes stop_codon:yes gene_type:complete
MWKPIETAPEETEVIIADPDRVSGEFHITIAWKNNGKWMRPNTWSTGASYIWQTHWMPLPKPPKSD